MNKLTHLTRSSFILIFFFGMAKVAAFLRSVIIARQFDLTFELDAFNVANNLPDLLFALISGGAMTMALIPVLSETISTKGRPAAWSVFSRVANMAFLLTGMFTIVIAIFAEQIVGAEIGIAPGFGPEERKLIAELMRLNLISTLIFSISGLIMGGLQANQHFLLPAMAPLLYNVGQIFGAMVLSPEQPYTFGQFSLPAMGLGVHGLVYGVIIGALLHLVIQIPGLLKFKFRWTASLNLDDQVIKVLRLVGPRVVTMLAVHLIFVARDNLASRLDQVGAITSLTYGWMIMQVPATLIGSAIATALLPTLSEHAAQARWQHFRNTIEKAIRVLLALSLPATAILAAGLRPLIAAVFGFDAAGTDMLTWTTRVYMLSLAGHAVLEIVVRAFYAQQDAIRPMIASIINTTVFILFGALVIRQLPQWGSAGIALVEMAFTAEAILLLWWLNKRMTTVPITAGGSLVRAMLGALAGGLAAYALAVYLPGGAIPTALVGMLGGLVISLPFIWREVTMLFRL